MFDMKLVGQRIAVMRKNASMTQMELANRLGISYQAVSNWERGVAMPDISNLGLLSRELGVTIDEIIGDEKISSVIKEGAIPDSITVDEFNAVSPLLDAETNRALLGSIQNLGSDDAAQNINVQSLSLTQEETDELAEKAFAGENVAVFACLQKYISNEKADELFLKAFESNNVAIVAILKRRIPSELIKNCLYKAVDAGNAALISILVNKK
ncbi:MAG: helix-turn-helix transcriptional regulator [Clostridia bacterium]|nr:helix-turn-helix transcriptional regulator [Clostridia bacterium]